MNTLGERLKLSFNLVFSNLGKYVGYNLVAWIISWLLAFVFIGLGLYLVYLNSSVLAISLSVVLVLLGLWLISAFSWLINYFLTKKFLDKEEVNLIEGIKFCFSNLWNKALVDLWYFVIILGPVLLIAVLVGLSVLFPYSIRAIAGIVGMLFGLFFLFYIFIKYFFSYYHCFDNKDFSLRQFKDSSKIVKGKFWSVLGNLLVVFIIAYLLFLIVQLIGNFIIVTLSHGVSFNQLIHHFVIKLKMGLKPDFVLLSLLIAYLIIRSLGGLFQSLYFIAYTYIYYRFLKSASKSKEEAEN